MHIDFISCLMESPDYNSYIEFAEKCANNVKIDNFETIKKCANNTEGIELLKDMGTKTTSFQLLNHVPTITMDEVKN